MRTPTRTRSVWRRRRTPPSACSTTSAQRRGLARAAASNGKLSARRRSRHADGDGSPQLLRPRGLRGPHPRRSLPQGRRKLGARREHRLGRRLGLATPARMSRAWMNSSGHRDNILSRNLNEHIGIGVARRRPGRGRRRTAPPTRRTSAAPLGRTATRGGAAGGTPSPRVSRVARAARHGRRPAAQNPSLRARVGRARSSGGRSAVRRHRRRAAGRAAREEPVQRRRDRPAARPTATTPTCTPRRHSRRGPAGRAGPGVRAGVLGARQEYRPGRSHAAPRLLRARARRGLRRRAHPAARAHAPRPEGGPAAPDAGHAREPLPHLQPLPRPGRRGRATALEPPPRDEPFATATDADGTENTALADRPTRTRSPSCRRRSPTRELLIADGHHRYETARMYAEEIGGEGEHRYVLMFLCSLQDPGLTVFPTHRLLTELKDDPKAGGARATALKRDFDIEEVERRPARADGNGDGRVRSATWTAFHSQPLQADAEGPGDRRRGDARHARALPPARHGGARGARAQGRARDERGRHLAPQRARLLQGLRRRARARSSPARPTPASSCAPRRSSRCARWPRPARRCRRSRRTSTRRSPPGLLFSPLEMKIYTRKGDDGTTGLWYGGRVAKSAGRPEAYGSVDEAAVGAGRVPRRGRARRRAARRHPADAERAVRGRRRAGDRAGGRRSGWSRACRRSRGRWSTGSRATSTGTWSGWTCRRSS